MAFKCKHCGFDLSVRMDLLALALQTEYKDAKYPEDLTLKGACEACAGPFSYGGEFFTHFMKTKAEEGIISPEVDDYTIVSLDISDEDRAEFKRLTELGDEDQLDAFLRVLMLKHDPDFKY